MGFNSYAPRPSGRSFYLNTYTPHFARHLHNLAISGFYARELDADDIDFIERVRVRGIANGTLENTSRVLLEELEYWHLPYAIDWSIARKHGPVATRGQGETAEARKARIEAWRKRNAERLLNNKIAAAELEREKAEWEAERAKRTRRELFTDAEWEANDPNRSGQSASGKISGKRKLIRYAGAVGASRFYTPQWKIDELAALKAAKQEEQAAKSRARRAAKARAEAEAQLAAVKREQAAAAARAKPAARQGLFVPEYDPTDVTATKNAIAAMIRLSYPAIWTPERLTHALGLSDVSFVVHCAEAMVCEGRLQTAKVRSKEPAT